MPTNNRFDTSIISDSPFAHGRFETPLMNAIKSSAVLSSLDLTPASPSVHGSLMRAGPRPLAGTRGFDIAEIKRRSELPFFFTDTSRIARYQKDAD
jgi:hypothetical protein